MGGSESTGEHAVSDQRIQSLHEATRALMDTRDKREVAEITVEAATEILDFPFSVVWLPTRGNQELEAWAVSAELETYVNKPDEPETEMRFERGSWLWDAYEADEPQCIDVTVEMAASNVPPHSAFMTPLDDHGLLTAGTEARREISDTAVRLVTILGKNTQAALARTEREQQLKTQRDHLKAVNRVLRHDIRNDLQLITTYTDLLADHVDTEGEDHLRTVRESAIQAADLTRTARDMTSAVLSAADETRPVRLKQTLTTEVDKVQSTHSDAVVTVDGSLPEVRVRGDDMLGAVFRNLIQNAIQHNDAEPPEVTISANQHEKTVEVRVADNGPGIPDDRKQRIFEEAESGHESTGSGLGLCLVETLVDLYGGDIQVEDNDPTGTVFVVDLLRAAESDSIG